jgi:hypothetical protein
MQRHLLTLVSTTSGWLLHEGGHERFRFARHDEALEAAGIMASTLHEHHGIPTAVILDLPGSDPVMVLSCG